MNDLVARRRVPLAVTAVVVAVVTLAIFRLPELYVSQMRRGALLTGTAATLAFWILLIVATGQAAYGGFRVLRTDQVPAGSVRLRPTYLRRRPSPVRYDPFAGVASTVAWVAAGLVGLTLVYGSAMFGLTGLRASFWTFVALMIVQLLWYYRLVGVVLRWLSFQQPPPIEREPPWERGDADYSPPIARGLAPVVRSGAR